MTDCMTQDRRKLNTQASKSPGAALAGLFGLPLRLIRKFAGSIETLLAGREGRHLVLVPAPALVPHPDRPQGWAAPVREEVTGYDHPL